MTYSRLLSNLLCGLSLCLGPYAYADEASTAVSTPAQTTTATEPTPVAVVEAPQANNKSWYSTAWDTAGQHLSDIWEKGDIEVYVPFWSKHLPFAYSAQKRATYTEYPAGGGLGKGWFNESGNWEGIYAMEYQDSHGLPQYQVGYGWVPTWHPLDDQFRVGAGVTAFFFFRSDIGHYAPIPAALPVLSTGYGPIDVQMTYIPGGQGFGNVLFWWAKYSFK